MRMVYEKTVKKASRKRGAKKQELEKEVASMKSDLTKLI